jgi:membrane-anchored glycerophosphoryl diester phosphodiesterase (GDPDase)
VLTDLLTTIIMHTTGMLQLRTNKVGTFIEYSNDGFLNSVMLYIYIMCVIYLHLNTLVRVRVFICEYYGSNGFGHFHSYVGLDVRKVKLV